MRPGLALLGDCAHVLPILGGEGDAVSNPDLRRIGDRKGVFLHSYPSLVPVRSRVASTVSSPGNPGVTGIAPARGLRQAPAWLRPPGHAFLHCRKGEDTQSSLSDGRLDHSNMMSLWSRRVVRVHHPP